MKHKSRNIILPIILGLIVAVCELTAAACVFSAARSCGVSSSLIDWLVKPFRTSGKSDEPPLHRAVRRGNVKELKRLLDGGADPNSEDNQGRRPLHIAAASGRTEAVKVLLKHGAGLEARTSDGYSSLHFAALNNRVGVIEQLIGSGAKVDGQNGEFGTTALFAAVQKGHENAANALINHGADVNFRISGFPGSPLQLAVVLGQKEVAKTLLTNGADVNERDPDCGATPVYFATVMEDKEVTALLAGHGADDTIEDNYGQSPRQAAAMMKLRKTRRAAKVKSKSEALDPHAIVQVLYAGTTQDTFNYRWPCRIAFAIGDGSFLLTAAHCIDDIIEESRNGTLVKPQVISRYYGDIFEADILAVDKEADVAILRVAWNGHPAIELASTEELSQAKEIIIAAYPPPKDDEPKGKLYRHVLMERLPVIRLDDSGRKEAIIVGGSRSVRTGWSGSPMILAGSGKVAGVFGSSHRKELGIRGQDSKLIFLHYLKGSDVRPVYSLFDSVGVNPGKPGGRIIRRKANAEKAFSILIECLEALTKQNIPRALSRAKKLVRLRPESVSAHLLLASLADANKETDKRAIELAETSHKEALKLAPDSVTARASYGNFLSRNKRNDEAIVEFKKAIGLEPDNAFALLKLVGILKDRDANEAELLARRLVERYPQNAGYWFELSKVLEKTGNHQEELEAARRAVSLNEDVPYQHRRRLADALVKVNQLDEADSNYKLLLKDHECPACWFAYASLLSKLGADRYDDAVNALEKAESMNQNKLVSPKKLKKLRDTLNNERKAK